MEPLAISLKIGLTTGLALLATVSNNLDDAKVSLVVVVPSTVFICGCVWWLGTRFQRIDDRLEEMQRRLDSLPCDDECGGDK